MLYRIARRLPSSHSDSLRIIARKEDRAMALVAGLFILLVVPAIAGDYVLSALLIPFLILSIAAIGLNLVMGYAGQASLGTGGFMAVGAYTSYKLATNIPEIPIVLDFFLGGLAAALAGILFGLPSLRLKAFYLAISTLAFQFFAEWLFSKVSWFWNDNASGVVSIPAFDVLGIPIEGPRQSYYLVCAIVAIMTLAAVNLMRSHVGRRWMAIRDNETAARLMGISVPAAKLQAFAISSFYCGVAGALWSFVYLKTLGVSSYSIDISFKIIFMIVIGGMGTILGSFIGAAFVLLMPVVLNAVTAALSLPIDTGSVSSLEQIFFGALVIYFVLVEPRGIMHLLGKLHKKLVSWPLNIGR